MDSVFGDVTSHENGDVNYADRLRNYFTAGCALTAIAVAKEVGILAVLLEANEALTSDEIADKGQLKERYCREILGALATSRVVEIDSDSRRYNVPVENRKALAGLAIYSRYVPYYGQIFEAIKNCFSKDGPSGIRYSDYPIGLDIMRESRVFSQDTLIEDFVLAVVPGLSERLATGVVAAEYGCGCGILSNNLAKRFPTTSFTASDVVDDLLVEARSLAGQMGLKNITYENRDIYNLPDTYKDKFDWIFIRDVIHDLPYPDKAMRQIYFSLKPGGELSLLECGTVGTLAENVGNMGACALYTLSTVGCLPESYQQPDSAALGGAWNVKTARAMIESVGFTLVKEYREKDQQYVHFVCRK